MRSVLQFSLLFTCWLAALATLLIFLETWFGISRRKRFASRRASGAYGVITVFVPMYGSREKVERTLRSIFNQSYPFIELILIYCEEDRDFAELAVEFRGARSHIPVRLSPLLFPIESPSARIRALDASHAGVRGKWCVILNPDVLLDRFAIEMAVEFAGSNEISALVLRPGIRCRSALQKIIAPSMEHILQMVRIANRRREKRMNMESDSSFLIVHREAFDAVNRLNRMPGILNDAGWSLWAYEVEGLRTFEGDGSRWMWRDADVRSWSSDTEPGRRYGSASATLVAASAVMAAIVGFGIVFGVAHGIGNFTGASILAFSGVSYMLMWISYFLFARRLRAASWFSPLWILSYLPAAALTLLEMRRISGSRTKDADAKYANFAK